MFNLRWYQEGAIKAGIENDNGVIVLPTGSGKSIVIAELVRAFEGKTLVLQPSKEILESNYEKIIKYGAEGVGIYSASAGVKVIDDVTYATIGSIIKKLHLFEDFESVIVDEGHMCNAKGGMYEKLIKTLRPKKLIGLTATPFRMHTTSFGSNARLITRTRPKLFNDIIYYANPRDLIHDGYLSDPDFIEFEDVRTDMLQMNTTGAELSDRSVNAFYEANNIHDKILSLVGDISQKFKHCLAFVPTVTQSQALVGAMKSKGLCVGEINAKTPIKKRAELIQAFFEGEIQFMVNVNTLAIGFDFPGLDCIIDARPTRSPGLHYQKIGRVMRPFHDKKHVVFDIAGNKRALGSPANYHMVEHKGLHEVISDNGRVTTRMLGASEVLGFGKYKYTIMQEVPDHYLDWGFNNFDKSNVLNILNCEIERRRLFC